MTKHLKLLAVFAALSLGACEDAGKMTDGSGGAGHGGTGGSGGATSSQGGSGGSGGTTNSQGGSAGTATGGSAAGGSVGSGGTATGGNAGGIGGNAGGSGGSGGKASGGSAGASGGSAGASGGASGGSAGVSGGGGSGGGTGGRSTGMGGATVGAGGNVAGAATGGAAAGGATGRGGSTGACSAADDTCPAPKGGLTWNCKKRFAYGVNYAWAHFGGDFGGIAAWSQKGVAGDKAARTTQMTEMKDNGVDVIRWWMFPDLRGDGIKLDGSQTPTGLGATVVDDINAALDIAKQLDLHIRLTLFSFDNFCATRTDSGLTIVGLNPIATDATKRAALISKVVVPIAAAVEASPNKDRMIGWDVINEPEWAISGSDGYGDQNFDPQSQCSGGVAMQAMTFPQAETFVKEVVTALHGASKAPVTVGGAAVKWAKAWSKVGLDYYDFHWYGWVDQYFPHTKTPADYKVDDKQVIVGEFPINPGSDPNGAFGGITYGKLIDDFMAAGYAGTQGWAFSDTTNAAFSWSTGKANVKSWAAAHTCYTHF